MMMELCSELRMTLIMALNLFFEKSSFKYRQSRRSVRLQPVYILYIWIKDREHDILSNVG